MKWFLTGVALIGIGVLIYFHDHVHRAAHAGPAASARLSAGDADAAAGHRPGRARQIRRCRRRTRPQG